MFAFKKKYYLLVENTKDIDFRKLKLFNKYIIIYRKQAVNENLEELLRFRKQCRAKRVEFFVSNDVKLMVLLKADGLYISAHNKDLSLSRFKNKNFKLIGSIHNLKELNLKKTQGCSNLIFSRLFKTHYKFKKGYLGIVKFNLFKLFNKLDLIPLGGINVTNINKLKSSGFTAFAMLSEIKKKPTKIFSRLF